MQAELLRSRVQVLRQETRGIDWRLLLMRLLAAPLPDYSAPRLRARLLKLAGFEIGQNCTFMGMPYIYGSGDLRKNLVIGKRILMNVRVGLNAGASLVIEDDVAFGQEVLLMTDTHLLGGAKRRAGQAAAEPVRICRGAWLAARSIVLPGRTVHEGAVVAAGAVVTKDVPPHTLVGGIPAVPIREL